MNFFENKYRLIFNLVGLIALMGCTEPFDSETEDFESVLVIDAVLTDEVKQQEVFLSRTYRFEEDIVKESNATVKIIEGSQTEYDFFESTPGTYVSSTSFAAKPNMNYQLVISTPDGGVYSSDSVTLTDGIPIDNLYASLATDNQNGEGINILVDNIGDQSNSGYYRFEYEETYKIVAPLWNPRDLIVVSIDPPDLDFLAKAQEEQVCYNTEHSLNLILANTTGLSENILNGYPVRSLNKNDYIISHRYSILVRQYSISREAHAFYETINEFSGIESIFSENQPGFFNGNFNTDLNERIVGFFDVSSVSSQRIFFNYKDFYPDADLPPFPNDCKVTSPIDGELFYGVKNGLLKFFAENQNGEASEGPYLMVPRVCGDCTVLGNNIIPEFWIE